MITFISFCSGFLLGAMVMGFYTMKGNDDG